MNDCVINAGAPHRSISLELSVDHQAMATIGGDGVIVATATGSTAYNLAAHGPVLMPELDGLIVNPLNPHSLSYRPVVLGGNMRVDIQPKRVNKGTDVVFDGQKTVPLKMDMRVSIVGAGVALIVNDPTLPPWGNFVQRFGWLQAAK